MFTYLSAFYKNNFKMVSLFQNMIILVSCRQICAPNHVQVQLSVGVLNGLLDSDYIQPVIQNTINPWYYMNLLWTIQIIKISQMSSMQQKCHRQYYVNFPMSEYLYFNQQSHTRYQRNKNFIDRSFSQEGYQINISQISTIYTIQKKIWA